jgi:hypothetical protein
VIDRRKKIQMTKMYIKESSSSPVIREMQIKMTIQLSDCNSKSNNTNRNVGKQETPFIALGNLTGSSDSRR